MDGKKKQPDQIKEHPITYETYAALPDDGNRYELVDGVLELMSPSATSQHQIASFEIQRKLADSCEADYMILSAPLDVILSPTEVRQPDLIMLHRSRLNLLTKRGVEGAPDLVVEILSPCSLRRDKISKMTSYARYGIPEYWIVDPQNGALEQYLLNGQSYGLHQIYIEDDPVSSPNIPCISFTIRDIMSKIPDLS